MLRASKSGDFEEGRIGADDEGEFHFHTILFPKVLSFLA